MISEKLKNDPSEIKQEFSNVNIKLLCCRYWVLQEWQCMNFSAPFWRIYHNHINGATVYFNGEITHLNQNNIVIIPPNTAFSTKIGERRGNNLNENIQGRKIEKTDKLEEMKAQGKIDHLFIHFSLGFPLDFAKSGIYNLANSLVLQQLIDDIQIACSNDIHFSLMECLKIKQLINNCLLNVGEKIWQVNTIDSRIFTAMQTIEKKFNHNISNADLANAANMATNSFSRLFKTCTGFSVQQYIAKTKIEVACNLMHHSNQTIDEIAYNCGFYDRHHFSKIFKKLMKVNPSYYMKNLIVSANP